MSNPLNQKEQTIKDKVLETLSFYDDYSWERLIVEFDENFLKENPDFAKEDLEGLLRNLKREGLVKITKSPKGELLYRRILKKRPWWRRLFA